MKKLMAIFVVMALVAFAAPALAANPFMDVPAGHWSYDAVAQLASRGVVSGYPDGAYKGAQPATRYEMASMVARALAQTDMVKASKTDVELLKKLVIEFKNELDALGVKVNDLDKRVSALEDGIGGWKLRGVFYFDAKFSDSDNNYPFTNGKESQFTKERFRLFLTKSIDENSYFYAQYRVGGSGSAGMGDASGGFWSHLYADTNIFWDMNFRVGRFAVDFEGNYDLGDAMFGDFRIDGFRLSKSFGNFNATAIVGRNSNYSDYDVNNEYMSYILDLSFTPNERFFLGATGYWYVGDSVPAASGDADITTYGVYAGYSITPSIAVKGVYYFQDLDSALGGVNPRAWKAILDVKQEALKFTSLWVEYSEEDNNFYGNADRYEIVSGGDVGLNRPANGNRGEYIFAEARQQWNDKFSTFVSYAHADFNTKGVDDATEWGVGAGYQYTPAIYFELMYDHVDHGDSIAAVKLNGKESVVRFRTTVSF